MTSPKTALLLIGSPKPAGESSSESLGTYLLERLAERGINNETQHVARTLRTEARTQELLRAVDRADLLILSFPLYVDSLPYLVTQALERIAAHRQALPSPIPASFLAIANCGFPEAEHNATALALCRQFASEAGFTWAGGLSLGEGGAISGRPLAAAGGMAHNVVAALDLAAAALAEGEPAPEEALALMARPFIPARAYMLMGDLGWLMQARRNRALTRLAARPFDRTKDNPWALRTPPGTSEYTMHLDEKDGVRVLVCTVGTTTLYYDSRCIDDLYTMLKAAGDWVELGGADEQKPAKEGTVEAWGRSPDNPIGGWYGLKKGLRGRFGVYLPPLMEALGLCELEHNPKNNRMRAR